MKYTLLPFISITIVRKYFKHGTCEHTPARKLWYTCIATTKLRLRIEAFKYKFAMAKEERGGSEWGVLWDEEYLLTL